MPSQATAQLRRLERSKTEFGNTAATHKLSLLKILQAHRLKSAAAVLRLHEVLSFMRAYPDNAQVSEQVAGMLDNFAARPDLKQHRLALTSSGITGTTIEFSFFAQSAMWLARNWGESLSIDWDSFENPDKLEALLPMLAVYSETSALDEMPLEVRAWLKIMKGADETEAEFFLRRIEQADMGATREMLLDGLDLPLRLEPGKDTPARTREFYAKAPIHYQTTTLRRGRPAMPADARRTPQAVHALSPREGQRIVELARSCMATRSRDLDAFAYGDGNDVRLVDCGDGLQFAWIGVVPEHRFMLESLYGYLMLKNGVPLGYGAATCLFNSCEIAYTVFDTYRAGESAHMYGWTLANIKHLFGVDTFMIDPYQLGQDNEDALASGAWWFYQKLGYRPRQRSLLQLMKRELRQMQRRPSHRTSVATLRELASTNVYLHLGRHREDVLGQLPLAKISLQITQYLAKHFGFDRDSAQTGCAKQAAKRLGLRSMRGFSPDEQLMWQRWAPLLMILPNLERWPPADRRAMVELIRAKGSRCDGVYTRLFDAHRRLRRALIRLARK